MKDSIRQVHTVPKKDTTHNLKTSKQKDNKDNYNKDETCLLSIIRLFYVFEYFI